MIKIIQHILLKIPVGINQKIYTQFKEVLPLLMAPPVSNSREVATVKVKSGKFNNLVAYSKALWSNAAAQLSWKTRQADMMSGRDWNRNTVFFTFESGKRLSLPILQFLELALPNNLPLRILSDCSHKLKLKFTCDQLCLRSWYHYQYMR